MSHARDKPFLLKRFQDADDVAALLDQYLDEIKDNINSRIDFDNSFSTKSSPTADAVFKIIHNLGYIPHRFLVVGQNGPGTVYRSKSAWTDTVAYFQCTSSNLEVEILIW